MTEQSILIVDADEDFLAWSQRHLTASGVKISTVNNSDAALSLVQKAMPDLVIVELRITPLNGLDLLRKIRQHDPNATVLLTTGFPPTSAVIEAMKLGAYDFLRKEALNFELRPVVESALQTQDAVRSAAQQTHQGELRAEDYRETIIGKSAAMQEVFKMIGRVSRAGAPVLITGESGCGKENVANSIHKFSLRASRPYVAINCAAIPADLLESELFGHEKGAFTGATTQRIGRFEQCDGGTLFLDEIGDMPINIQSKILRVLQEGEFSRVGGNQTLKSDARIIAATNRELEKEVAEHRFREDLFYRLNVVRIHIPPLRQRREDVPLLVDFFLQRIAEQRRTERFRITDEAMQLLIDHDWPGNVRELENTVQRACVLATSKILLPKDFPIGRTPYQAQREIDAEMEAEALEEPDAADHRSASLEDHQAASLATSTPELHQAVEILLNAAAANEELELLPWLEREMTLHAMRRTGNNQVRAAKLLGITRGTLRKRLERYGLF
ncbi:MAG: two-component system, NtrC family, nitrogen regulation response regulator GlnG/two-component system [Verrucomicrobia bacterium]|nr:MAG: two-component system, NtrC family, nitrogen regulation response regulator GlnG/two-component system [Verrucomicrobiota bacterium]